MSVPSARLRGCPGAPNPPSRSGTQSIERAIAVLECLSASEISLSLSEISRHVGLSASTTHRLLRALTQAGYVDQDHSTERYGLGIGVAVLGQRAIERSGYQLARPVLAALSERTGESARPRDQARRRGRRPRSHCRPGAPSVRPSSRGGTRRPRLGDGQGVARVLQYLDRRRGAGIRRPPTLHDQDHRGSRSARNRVSPMSSTVAMRRTTRSATTGCPALRRPYARPAGSRTLPLDCRARASAWTQGCSPNSHPSYRPPRTKSRRC